MLCLNAAYIMLHLGVFSRGLSESQKRRSIHRRMVAVGIVFLLAVCLVITRLIELQLVRGATFRTHATQQHYGKVTLQAKRGDIFGVSSTTGELSIFATNSTRNLIYVDPNSCDIDHEVCDPGEPKQVAQELADLLLTPKLHAQCRAGMSACPTEFVKFYVSAFDPLVQMKIRQASTLLEPLPPGKLPEGMLPLPDLAEARKQFAEQIERRISSRRVIFAPLKYGATHEEVAAVNKLAIGGVVTDPETGLVYANPEQVRQVDIEKIAKSLASVLQLDDVQVQSQLRSKPLRYVPILSQVPTELAAVVLEAKSAEARAALQKMKAEKKHAYDLQYPLRSVALIPQHWRFYPDTTIASQVVGFLNTKQEPQYGIERTFDVELRGQDGKIRAANDLHGGQIMRPQQEIDSPVDGDAVVLTLDRVVQKYVEGVLTRALATYRADSAQAIIMDPATGRVIAMVNAPVFDSNNYADVSAKEPITLDPGKRAQVEVEITHPDTHVRVVRRPIDDVYTASGRTLLPADVQGILVDLEKKYNLRKITRYYQYIGQYYRHEIFPTDDPLVWLKYKNNIGLGAYLNRTVQEIYEPGSVFKPITMAIAIDQNEVIPADTYDDFGPVEVDQYTINNNDKKHYGTVDMAGCLKYSINTCMTSISFKLGPKLFLGMVERFGFGRVTSIELDDELAGEVPSWTNLPRSTLATIAFGQGISSTPLQVITAWCAMANGGKLLRPSIIDSVIHPDGTRERTPVRVVDQVITPEASETITALLAQSANSGFARAGKVDGYRMAGKTGTSQIAGPGGRYETGTGSTIATYAGFAPLHKPKFVMLIKVDRPKNSIHGATVAAPIFKEIATFLFRYYGIPPDERAS